MAKQLLRIKKILEGDEPIDISVAIIEEKLDNKDWRWTGKWEEGKIYSLRDVFTRNGATYICLTDHKDCSPEEQQWIEKIELFSSPNQGSREFVKELSNKIEEVNKNLEEKISEIESTPGEKGEPGEPGEKPIAGVDYEIPTSGQDYILTEEDKDEIASRIKVPVVEKIIEKTEVIKEQPIVTNEIKEVAKYEKPLELAKKLNTLKEKVEMKVIKGLKAWMREIEKKIEDRLAGVYFGSATNTVIEEEPDGTINGVNTIFTLEHRPTSISNTLKVYVNGLRFKNGEDYTISVSTITFTNAPPEGSNILVDYEY